MPAQKRRLTEAEIRRKTNKPIMEKKRRQRINKSLDELKSIVLNSLSESSRPNKIEKADILEMTVRYVRKIQAKISTESDKLVLDNENLGDSKKSNSLLATSGVDGEREGYTWCVREVSAYVDKVEGIATEFRNQLVNHLADRYKHVSARTYATKRSHQSFVSSPEIAVKRKRDQSKLDVHSSELLNPISGKSKNSAHIQAGNCTSSKLFGYFPHNGPMRNPATASCPIPRNDCSLVASSSSNISSVASRKVLGSPSPCLSSTSNTSEDSVTEVVGNLSNSCHHSHSTDGPRPPHFVPQRVAEHYLSYVSSSDSGNWSSGSNPPSPILGIIPCSTAVKSNGDAVKLVKKETSPVSSGVWQPWI